MENVNKEQRNFISLSELEYGPLSEIQIQEGSPTFEKVSKRNNRHKDGKNASSFFKRRSRCCRVVGS